MSGDKCLKIHMALNVWRQMSGVKCLKHQNGRQMSWRQISQQSNVLALNVFDIKSLEVKHPASNVWGTNIIGVKQLESEQQTGLHLLLATLRYISNGVQTTDVSIIVSIWILQTNIVLVLRLEIISFLSIATEKGIGKPECIQKGHYQE